MNYINELFRLANDIDCEMPKRPLGMTGWDVSLISLGGQGSLETQGNRQNCLSIIERAISLGINYFDTAPIYGPSEDLYGEILPSKREDICLASKTDDRSRDGSLRLLEESLKRLKTDYLDIWQIHHLDNINEVDRVCEDDGALQALIEMKEQGVVKHLGFTGHQYPHVLMEMIDRYEFDTVLCPVNPSDANMNPSFEYTVVPEASSRNMGIIGMKVFSQGYIFHPKGITTTWEALNYATSHPVSTIIVGHDTLEQLEQNVALVKAGRLLSEGDLFDLEERASGYEDRGSFFRGEFGGYDSQNKLKPPYTVDPKGTLDE